MAKVKIKVNPPTFVADPKGRSFAEVVADMVNICSTDIINKAKSDSNYRAQLLKDLSMEDIVG